MARTVTLPTERGAIIRLTKDHEGVLYFGVLIADYSGPDAVDDPDAELVFFIAGNFIPSSAADVKEMLEADESITYEIIPAPFVPDEI